MNANAGTVGIYFGNGDYTFTSSEDLTQALFLPHGSMGTASIATADINNDGNSDLIATSSATNSIYLLLNNGDRTFQPSLQTAGDGNNTSLPTLQHAISGGPAYLAIGDFNRDGKPDLVVTEQSGNSLAVLLNNTLPTPKPGGDSFASATTETNMDGNMADSIAVADFNHDGKPDMAIAYLEDNAVRVLLHDNTGTVVTYSVGSQPYDVVSGDLNGDGYPDLVTANAAGGTISVLLNKGNTGGGTLASAVAYSVGHDPFQVAIGDINGDGIPDLAVTNNGDNTVSILYGVGDGTFTAGSTLTTGTQPYGIAIGRFGSNGANDIAVTCYSSSQLYIFPNNGTGTFGSPNIYSTDSNPAGVVIADFNRDGKLDIVTGNTIANDISYFAGNGDGTFKTGVTSGALNFPNSVAVGDINGDGIPDLATNASNFNEIAVLLGNGDGSFQTRVIFTVGIRPWAVALTDWNHNGKLDLATANVYNTVNLTTVANQARYVTEYPPVVGGNPSASLALNLSGTQITLSDSPNGYGPNAYNVSTTLTAVVASLLGGATPTGTVIFEDNGGVILGTAPSSLSSGTATLTLPNLGSGTHIFTALYSGDANYQPNTTATNSGYFLSVSGTTVNLGLASPTLIAGNNLTYTVTAGVTGGGTDPAGTVTLYGISTSGTVTAFDTAQTLVGNGDGTSSVTHSANPGVTPGNYELYAVYTPGGGSNYTTGSSSDQPLTIAGLPTSTTLNCVPETYFGFPTGEDECYSQVLATSAVLQQGNVAFAVNGGSQNIETIQDLSDYYSTPTLIGYYAAYIFPTPTGSYTATASFQSGLVNGTYYAGSSASGSFQY